MWAAAVGLLSAAARGQEALDSRQPLVWYIYELDPFHIVSGPDRGQGYGDKTLDDVEKAMPQYRFNRQVVPFTRLLANMKTVPNSCTLGLVPNPERAENYLYSKPFIWTQIAQFAVQESRANEVRAILTPDHNVPLSRVDDAGFRDGGLAIEHHFVAGIDAHVSKARADGRMFDIEREDLVLAMLARGRFDYSFSAPDEIGYFNLRARRAGLRDRLISFPIEGSPDVAISHLVCARSEVGAEVIAAANALLDKEAVPPSWFRHYLRWIDPTNAALFHERVVRHLQENRVK
ncbi:hypothetical protein [Gimibacter soli]|uniref:Solute-binding protein family 3/N-terminal domain-containing protein n=1 Tax=Gimibacter soli TaxID=3024400 RepID=A0AAE9XUL1_9PROT|nr:hypothetical protein [Gimibacter soli]WCL55356.1 hypothetical protein PH603_06235 [Gimibacter soli]